MRSYKDTGMSFCLVIKSLRIKGKVLGYEIVDFGNYEILFVFFRIINLVRV